MRNRPRSNNVVVEQEEEEVVSNSSSSADIPTSEWDSVIDLWIIDSYLVHYSVYGLCYL